MITWTEHNNSQLKRLNELIIDTSPYFINKSCELKSKLEEVNQILKNENLDLDNLLGELEKPVIIEASIWNNHHLISCLLEKNLNISRTINFYELYGEGEETEWCKNIEVNSLDILIEQRKKLNEEQKLGFEVKHQLNQVNECLEIIEKYIKTNNVNLAEGITKYNGLNSTYNNFEFLFD